ncbi:hypothetical protein BHE17_16135 [Planococcus maritimus]|nr:hypothetical protein BHE17_16135 [Planococcus maritimus]
MKPKTRLIHGGIFGDEATGAVSTPIYRCRDSAGRLVSENTAVNQSSLWFHCCSSSTKAQ